jgi:hypothetical protein
VLYIQCRVGVFAWAFAFSVAFSASCWQLAVYRRPGSAALDHPGWFIPVALVGTAYLQLGQKDKGLIRLKEADAGMVGNPDRGSLPSEVKRVLSLRGQ